MIIPRISFRLRVCALGWQLSIFQNFIKVPDIQGRRLARPLRVSRPSFVDSLFQYRVFIHHIRRWSVKCPNIGCPALTVQCKAGAEGLARPLGEHIALNQGSIEKSNCVLSASFECAQCIIRVPIGGRGGLGVLHRGITFHWLSFLQACAVPLWASSRLQTKPSGQSEESRQGRKQSDR